MIILLLFSQLFAQDVAIQGNQTTEVEYETHLVKNPDHFTFIKYHLQQQNFKEHDLLDDLKKAQFEFLNGSMEKAKKTFQKIVDQRHDSDWPKKVQKTIHYSFLRLAQLSSSKDAQDHLLDEAMTYAPNLPIDKTLFPPPLLKSYDQRIDQKKIQVWKLPKNANQFSTLLVNGQEVKKHSSFLKYRSGTVRLSFLSNKLNPVHFTLALDKLETLNLPLSPIASGSCTAPALPPSTNKNINFILIDQSCSSLPGSQIATKKLIEQVSPIHSKTSVPKILKSRWFWVGASIVATGFALNSIEQNRKKGAAEVSSMGNSPKEFSNQ